MCVSFSSLKICSKCVKYLRFDLRVDGYYRIGKKLCADDARFLDFEIARMPAFYHFIR